MSEQANIDTNTEEQQKQETSVPKQKDSWLDIDHFDVIILGTGLTESFLAGYSCPFYFNVQCSGSSWKNCSSFRQE